MFGVLEMAHILRISAGIDKRRRSVHNDSIDKPKPLHRKLDASFSGLAFPLDNKSVLQAAPFVPPFPRWNMVALCIWSVLISVAIIGTFNYSVAPTSKTRAHYSL